jgi:hypothetical protein
VLSALRRGLKDPDARKASQSAIGYVQLVYGRQLQQQADETTGAPFDLATMSRADRDALKRERWSSPLRSSSGPLHTPST